MRKMTKEIQAAISANDVLLVIADTGSGKTTQIPQIILDADPSAGIVVTQPRRVAAITVAGRVANERGAELGAEVGYAVRFEDRSQRGITKIRYVTDGVLLREALSEGPGGLRKRYSHLIVDEVHERSVNTDLVLGVVKEILTNSPGKSPGLASGFAAKNELFAKMIRSTLPFKVIIMSATTNAEKILSFFRKGTSLSVELLKISGSLYPVRTMYATKPSSNIIDSSILTVCQVDHKAPLPGDILVFMPGQDEILTALETLKLKLKACRTEVKRSYLVYPLFAALSPEDQMKAIEPLSEEERKTTRKIILSTNIAETSLTIPGITYVIDSGLVKVRSLILQNGVHEDALQVEDITQAQAEQRRGRAGRTGPGQVYRLYTEEHFKKLKKEPKPEILRLEASLTLLQIIALRSAATKILPRKDDSTDKRPVDEAKSFTSFPLLDSVPDTLLKSSLETLCLLGAINFSMQLKGAGRLMSRIPVAPMLARSLLESLRVGCVDAMLSVAAVLSVEGVVFLSPRHKREKARIAQRRFLNPSGDHLTLVNALNAFIELSGRSRRTEFCRDHFLSFRALQSAESIRCQLDRIMHNGDMVSWGLRNPLPASVTAAVEEASLDEVVCRCLVAGFFRNVAVKRKEDGKYTPFVNRRNGGHSMEAGMGIYEGSALRALRVKKNPEVVVYNELIRSENGKGKLRTVTSVEGSWLVKHSSYFTERYTER